ncbi:YlbG family protein [Streptococcus tangpeifui]|uniref:YlbG family protein n=1 Tax=Streptococcus tangpeifui TaxID=2709400 RepID=UPI0013EB30DC|nr:MULTISPECIES: YlbG family protein [unclassified Streptococcus]
MFEKQERLGIIVYLYYNRDARKLNRYGDMIYHSRRFRYVHLYLDADKLEETLEILKKLKFVKRVRQSHFDEIDRDFVGSLYREDNKSELEPEQS